MNQPQQENPNKLFVGNLPFSASEDQLRELFSEYGEIVDVKLITDRMSGRSKGFGFVEFASQDSANQALEALNGYELDGRALVVNVARPQMPRENRPGGGYNRGGNDRRGGYRDSR